MVEWRATVAPYATAWKELGVTQLYSHGKDRRMWPHLSPVGGTDPCFCLCASLTPDGTGAEFRALLQAAEELGVQWILYDAPVGANLEGPLAGTAKTGGSVNFTILTSWYGDRVARRRICGRRRLVLACSTCVRTLWWAG